MNECRSGQCLISFSCVMLHCGYADRKQVPANRQYKAPTTTTKQNHRRLFISSSFFFDRTNLEIANKVSVVCISMEETEILWKFKVKKVNFYLRSSFSLFVFFLCNEKFNFHLYTNITTENANVEEPNEALIFEVACLQLLSHLYSSSRRPNRPFCVCVCLHLNSFIKCTFCLLFLFLVPLSKCVTWLIEYKLTQPHEPE